MKITNYVVRQLAGLVCVASLSACGGGSGCAGTSSPNPAGSSVTLTPSAADLVMYEGDAAYFTITATSGKVFPTPVHMSVYEKADVVSPVYDTTMVSPQEYRADMHTWLDLSLGMHETSLEVRMCEDSAAQCKIPVPGSPWFYPVKLTVKPKAEAAGRLTVSPVMDLTTTYGKSLSFTINLKAVTPLGRQVYVSVIDPSARIIGRLPILTSVSPDYSPTMVTSPTLAPGTYSSALRVQLCQDSALACKLPLAGSPWFARVNLTVTP
jgi:hypothetical protein